MTESKLRFIATKSNFLMALKEQGEGRRANWPSCDKEEGEVEKGCKDV